MPEKAKKAEPIRQSVRVDCPIEDAFHLFIEEFGEWWPLAEYSVSGNDAESCVIEPWVGGRIFERSRTGEEHEWGWVRDWDPPSRLSLTWNPGGGTDDASQTVDIQFEVQADGTRVTVTHTGWEAPGVAVCSTRGDYAWMGTAALLECFCALVAEQMVAA